MMTVGDAKIANNVSQGNYLKLSLETGHTSPITHIIVNNPFALTVAKELKFWDLTKSQNLWTYDPHTVWWSGFVKIVEGNIICSALSESTDSAIHILNLEGSVTAILKADIFLDSICVTSQHIFALMKDQQIVQVSLRGKILRFIPTEPLGTNRMFANDQSIVRFDGSRVLIHHLLLPNEEKDRLELKFPQCKNSSDELVAVSVATFGGAKGEKLYCGLQDFSNDGNAPDCAVVALSKNQVENTYKTSIGRSLVKVDRSYVTKCLIHKDRIFLGFSKGAVFAQSLRDKKEVVVQGLDWGLDKPIEDLAISGDVIAILTPDELRLINYVDSPNTLRKLIKFEKFEHSKNVIFEEGKLIYTIEKAIHIFDYNVHHQGEKSASGICALQ